MCGPSPQLGARQRLFAPSVLQQTQGRWYGSWLRLEWMSLDWICLMETMHLIRKLLIWLKNIMHSPKTMSLQSCLTLRQVHFILIPWFIFKLLYWFAVVDKFCLLGDITGFWNFIYLNELPVALLRISLSFLAGQRMWLVGTSFWAVNLVLLLLIICLFFGRIRAACILYGIMVMSVELFKLMSIYILLDKRMWQLKEAISCCMFYGLIMVKD